MAKPNPLENVELDLVMALLDKSLGDVKEAVAVAQTHLRKARVLSAAIREQSGRIRLRSDEFRLRLGPAIHEEVTRASQRPAAG